MLHCYILPKITLHKNDLDKVINAGKKQALNIQMLDKKVIEECKAIDACELQMEDLRTQFLPNLEAFINKGWCSKEFLDLLLEDVGKEEPRVRQEVHAHIYRSTGNKNGFLSLHQKCTCQKSKMNLFIVCPWFWKVYKVNSQFFVSFFEERGTHPKIYDYGGRAK